MRYAGNGKFLMAVFHEEKDPYDPDTDQITRHARLPGSAGAGHAQRRLQRGAAERSVFLLTYLAQQGVTTYQQLLPDNTVQKGITIAGWSSRAYLAR